MANYYQKDFMKKHTGIGKNAMNEAGRCATVVRMYSDFRHHLIDACGPADIPLLNVALAYEDYLSGTRALQTFEDLFEYGREQFQFNMRNAWKFDCLRINRFREAAIAETLRSDLVIISTRGAEDLPPSVKWWVEASLEQREGDPGALVLMHTGGGHDESSHPKAEVYLADCASRLGMDFFVKRDDFNFSAKSTEIRSSHREPGHRREEHNAVEQYRR